MRKSTKRFTVSTEAVNGYGFRVLTAGINMDHFRRNPVMLWMHKRATGGSRSEVLPLGFWEDLEVRDGAVTAVPVFDDKDPFALSIYHKVENGTLRMASVGIVANRTEKLGGVSTVTESTLKEISIVDIGANADALAAALYDENDQLINLADFGRRRATVTAPEKAIGLEASKVCGLLGLPDTATGREVMQAIGK
ncbi:hypothetical protein, partial [Rufibacter immobilis]|uniref:hypothetical protein n=1 Tax=Rufibacter immobilis TaxID=1348778 RepID=UPI0035E89825